MDGYCNLDIICNAKIDTVMYGLPPERTGKRSRPKKYGERLLPEDFELESPKNGSWKMGVRPVLTRLWGEQAVYTMSHSKKREWQSQTVLLPKPRKESHLTTGIVQMMPFVNTERKTSAISRWPATCSAETLRYHTMKAKTFWSLKKKALNG